MYNLGTEKTLIMLCCMIMILLDVKLWVVLAFAILFYPYKGE